MARRSHSGSNVQLPLSEADQLRLDTWAVELATELRPGAPQTLGSEDEIRIGRQGSLTLYPDGHWFDYEADVYGPGAFSLILHDLNGDLAAATRFATEWLRTHQGNGSREPHQTASMEAENRAKRHAEWAQQVLQQVAPLPGTTSATYLNRRALHGPYSDALLGHLERYRANESAIVAKLTDAAGVTLGIQIGHLTLDGRKSGIPQRHLFWIPLEKEQRHAGLFRPTPAPLPAESDRAAELVDVTLLVEGLENALSVAAAFPWATVLGLPGIGRARHVPPIKGNVIFVRDGDEPGCPADKSLTRGIDHLLLTGTKTVSVTATPLREDANSILQSGGVEALRSLILAAEPVSLSLGGEAQRLARIRDPLQYDRERNAVAKAHGVRKSAIDAAVAVKRETPGGAGEGPVADGGELGPIPWPEPVDDIGAVLAAASDEIGNYVVTSRAVRDTAVLWSLFTHFVHHSAVTFMIGARLGITAVSPASGKTTLLSSVQQLAYRPMPAASLTQALVNRVVDQYHPTLFIDEADKLLRSNRNPELIALLNASHNRLYANIPRLVPTPDGGWQVGMFSCWHVHAFTSNGKLDDQQQSRTIAVTVRRAKPAELAALRQRTRQQRSEGRFQDGVSLLLRECGRKFARWSADQPSVLDDVDLPDAVDFRDQDNWRPLFRLGALVGGEWPKRIRDASIAVNGVTRAIGDVVLLLEDIRAVFGEKDRLTTDQMVQGMLSLPEPSADWQTAHRGRPVNAYYLRERLKGLVDAPEKARKWRNGATFERGYLALHFTEAFERYLQPEIDFASAEADPSDSDFFQVGTFTPNSSDTSATEAKSTTTSTSFEEIPVADDMFVGSGVAEDDPPQRGVADEHVATPDPANISSATMFSDQHVEISYNSVAGADVADKSGANPSSRKKPDSPAGSNDNVAKPPNGEDQPPVAAHAANDAAPPASSNGSENWPAAPRRHPEWWTR